jgi:hypothetical protein
VQIAYNCHMLDMLNEQLNPTEGKARKVNRIYMLSLLIVVRKTSQIRVRKMFEILRYMGTVIEVNGGRNR